MRTSAPSKPRPLGARKRSVSERERSNGQRPISHGYVKSFDGTKLFYSVEGTGKPLVFCYGLVCSSLHWTYQIEHFKNHYKTIWFDYRGHQNSEVPKNLSSLTIENIARDLITVLDELNVPDAVVLGHSMGVNVVLDFYRQQPQRVLGMVLANGTAQRPLETLFRNNALQAGFRLLRKIYDKSPELVRTIWKTQRGNPIARTLVSLGGFNPHLTPQADIELYVDQVADTDPAILIHLIENYDSYDATAWLHTVHVPTLILSGEKDKVIPLEQQELMKQLIPRSQLEVIHHGSHCPQMDLPDLVNLRIEKFLQELNY
ncbi:MAG: alpha/beta hydrolase [Bdellovibrio sp.]|nr:alpha/beta hydrolase [Bdellovibrio sp.]